MSTKPNPDTFAEASQEEQGLSVKDFLRVLWRRLWVVVLTAVVLAGSVAGYGLLQTPTYEASIKVLAGQAQQSSDGPASNLGSDVQGLQQITSTMAEAVDTEPVAEAVIRELNLDVSLEDFLENLRVEQVGSTQFIDIFYRDTSASRAQEISNTVGEVFSEQVSVISPNTNSITATVWKRAEMPNVPYSPNPLRDGLLALVLGGMLGVGLAFLLEHLDDRWRSPEEVEQISGVPTFGVIRQFKASKSKKGRD